MVTSIRLGALWAAAALGLAAAPAAAQIPIPCLLPNQVPGDFLEAIDDDFDFPDPPSQELCEKIAKTEVKACKKAVKNAKKCHDALNKAYAKSAKVGCEAEPSSSAEKACKQDVAEALDEQNQQIDEQAEDGKQECEELGDDVVDLCLDV
jgi:hypothetical protein